METNITPAGCGAPVDSLYFNLCDTGAVWGVVVESFAAAGVVVSFVLFVSLLASIPFTQDGRRRSSIPLQATSLVFTAGLFGLTFAFIVGKDFSTCAARRFLFGVLFGGCFACLLMQSVRLNFLSRRDSGPGAGPLCAAALALWLVEVVINTEWLIITVVRRPVNATTDTSRAAAVSCRIAEEDFVMALIYVMVLLLAALVSSLAIMAGKHQQWKVSGACVLLANLLSVCVWVAWIVMYVYGNNRTGGPTWADPTLAIALVVNAWLFLAIYSVPEICSLTSIPSESPPGGSDDLYLSRGVGYETILKEQSSPHMFVENKAFSMEEPRPESKPVSPYSGYTGQLRSSVYQPTELALISTATANRSSDASFDMIIPRASTASAADSGNSTPSTHAEMGNAAYSQANGNSVNGQHRTTQW